MANDRRQSNGDVAGAFRSLADQAGRVATNKEVGGRSERWERCFTAWRNAVWCHRWEGCFQCWRWTHPHYGVPPTIPLTLPTCEQCGMDTTKHWRLARRALLDRQHQRDTARSATMATRALPIAPRSA